MLSCPSLRRALPLLLGCVLFSTAGFFSAPGFAQSAASEAALSDDVTASAVRVRLLGAARPQALTLTLRSGSAQLYAGSFNNEPLATLGAGETATVRFRGDEVHWRADGGGGLYAQSLRLVPAEGATYRLAVTDGARAVKPRTYAGTLSLDVEQGALRLINSVGLETYVAGVVASEYGFDDLEGSKAMAVAARTYALQAAGRFSEDYDHVDEVDSQVYRGVGAITRVAREAAEATRGEVLTHGGALIEAVYFSSSGGRTASNEDVWSAKPLPYLRGKEDPYDDASPYQTWRATLNRSTLLRRLSRRHGFDVSGFEVDARSEDGRVETVDLIGADGRRHRIGGNAFRLFASEQARDAGIRSTWFEAERRGDRYVFEGRGYGHGVGMNQHGARAMAERGEDYREILSFYYTDVRFAEVESLAPMDAPPEAIAEGLSAERDPAEENAAEDAAAEAPLPGEEIAEGIASEEAADEDVFAENDAPDTPRRPLPNRLPTKPVKEAKGRIGW